MAVNAEDASRQFEALYADYGDRLYRFCHRLTGNPSDAEDLTQEVFLAAYRGLNGFQGRSSAATWLYRIAVFRWRKMRPLETAALESDVQLSAPDHAGANADRMSLDGAIGALPTIFREAFLLVKGEGLTCREAAEALGVPQGTVKFRVYRAVRLLRARLREDGWDEAADRDILVNAKEACDDV